MSLFPAAFQPPRIDLAEPIVDPDEASCFYHPAKRAVAHCDICGRFLCALCRIELGRIDLEERNLCPVCLENGRRTRTIERLEPRRVLYDNIALGAATIPVLFVWPAIFGAMAALFVALRYWRAPGSIVPRSRVRFWLAIVLALLEIAAMVTLVVILVRSRL